MGYTLLSEVEHTARKAHRCIWCGEGIAIGSRYIRERSIFDGEPQSHKWHLECLGAARDGWAAGDDAEFSPGSNDRPPTAASIEFGSWDCTLLLQGRLEPSA